MPANQPPYNNPPITGNSQSLLNTQTAEEVLPRPQMGFGDARNTYRYMLENLRTGRGAEEWFPGMLETFRGSEEHLADLMRRTAPMFASTLYSSEPYQQLQNWQQWDKSMQAYGTGAGMIARGAQQAGQEQQNQLGRAGLARSGASAAIAQQAQQTAATQQSDLWTRLYQAQAANRARYAAQAYDVQRNVAQLALGMTPSPRISGQEQNLWPSIISAAGQAGGAYLGSQGGDNGGTQQGQQGDEFKVMDTTTWF